MRCCIKKMICTDGHSDHWGHWGHVLCNVSGFWGVLMTWGGIYLCWLLEVKMKTNWKIKWFCFFSTVFLSLLRGGWDVTKHKYFVTVPKYIFQVSVLYLSIYISDSFWLFLPTFEHKYLNSLLLTFSQQARDFSLNSFEGNNGFNLFASVACRLSNVTRLISVGARHSRQT